MAAQSSLSTMHCLASHIYKADVYDNSQDKIGVVTDFILDNSGNVTTAVVGVGGLLGASKKDVAVPFKDLRFVSRDGKDWLVLNQTKDKLKMAPAMIKTNSPAQAMSWRFATPNSMACCCDLEKVHCI